ncbi:5-methylcytosine-specific restriction endonuclease system specificity protein McrC [Rhizobium sp. S96]|uniref:5-methylcytosine-specific restriction endonuclease system specificity protein McrC n=1 Tax=Rhizobium sp. S96 TaxID=3055140 RepID=UPI0025AB1D51|nr:5-methylcytosine-specific restriction endonuclease system specificity protein McrC [Rhizobium sp. S96]MDM9621107.1 5-methylcytosine-specific restriction endonuclease system specificity protein McrC [Rhizobium sp. S96]
MIEAVQSPISNGPEQGWKSRAGIPIRNLWVLLVYAAGLAQFIDPFEAAAEDDAELADILGRLLANVVSLRLRRSLSRGYATRAATLNRVRGRIDWLRTESEQLLSRGQIACRFDELTQDTPRNRLVLAALVQIQSKVANKDVAQQCAALARFLVDAGVLPKRPSRAEISRDKIARNDANDVVMVKVAELALDLVLPAESEGTEQVPGLVRDEFLLRRIFEQAVAGFYRHEIHGRDGWSVDSQTQFEWEAHDPTDGLHAILPIMKADVVLRKRSERRIVLDTKFTGILTSRYHGGEGLKSAYLYQIYSYLRSQAGMGDECADRAEGILLHPSIHRHVDEAVTIQGHRVRFVTVDLSAHPSDLRRSLLDIIMFQR